MSYKRPKLKLDKVYQMVSGYCVLITYKRKFDGKTRFIGESIPNPCEKHNISFAKQDYYEFTKYGDPIGASNSQIIKRIKKKCVK